MHYMNYPLASEKLKITYYMLSNYCSSISNEYDIKIGGVNKLVPNLDNKVNMFFNTETFSCIYH